MFSAFSLQESINIMHVNPVDMWRFIVIRISYDITNFIRCYRLLRFALANEECWECQVNGRRGRDVLHVFRVRCLQLNTWILRKFSRIKIRVWFVDIASQNRKSIKIINCWIKTTLPMVWIFRAYKLYRLTVWTRQKLENLGFLSSAEPMCTFRLATICSMLDRNHD